MTYRNESTFLSTAPISSTEDFEAFPDGDFRFGSPTIVVDKVVYNATTGGDWSVPGPWGGISSSKGLGSTFGGPNEITFGNGEYVKAFGFYFISGLGAQYPWEIEVFEKGGSSKLFNVQFTSTEREQYYGFLSDIGIERIIVRDYTGDCCSTNWNYDNVSRSNPVSANGTVFMSMAAGVKQDPAGGFTNADLNGRYYIRRLGIHNFETSYKEAETCYGYIDFNGAGSWVGDATCFVSDGTSGPIPSFSGTYSVNTNGTFTFIFNTAIDTGHISSDKSFAILSDGFVDSSGIHQGIVTALRISDTSLSLSDLNGTWRFRELELHDFENVNGSAGTCSGTMVCNNGNWNGNVECLDSDGSMNNETVSGTYVVNGKSFDIYTTGNPEVLFSANLSKDENIYIFTRGSSSGNELFKGIALKEGAKTYTNADLFGTYFFHDAYIEDFETDNREFSITVGTVTLDGNGNWTGTADSFDSDGSSGSDNISGTYSVNSDGSFTLIVTSETPDVTITGTISDDNDIIVFGSGGKISDAVKSKAMPWIPLLLLDE
jgi:hypothetical protein